MPDSALVHKAAVFETAFRGYEGPPFSIRLWDGWQWSSPQHQSPVCTIVVNSPRALAALIAHPNEITLGEAFIREDIDVEGDIFSVFQIAEHLFNRPHGITQQLAEKCAGSAYDITQWLKHGAASSKPRDRASIAYHYDLPAAFFEPWLGKTLVYSCAYFARPENSLDAAQEQKLDLICRKLRLQPGEHFLDIGCGWGSLVLHAGGRRHAHAEGITLSQEQAATGQRRIREADVADCCSIEFKDYRELPNGKPRFDKIASVGMFEHVGLKNLPLYFNIAWNLLRPGGLFLNHAIARTPSSHAMSFPTGIWSRFHKRCTRPNPRALKCVMSKTCVSTTSSRCAAGLPASAGMKLVSSNWYPAPRTASGSSTWRDRRQRSIAAPSASTRRCSAGLTTATATCP
jgi:cyclopropane-fatty-acyl-phospholipid synthase